MARSKIFLFLLLAFSGGVAFRSFVFVAPSAVAAGAALAAFLIAAGISRRKNFAIAGFLVIAFLGGIFRFDSVQRAAPDLSELYGKPISARGIVWEEPERAGNIRRIKAKIVAVRGFSEIRPFYVLMVLRAYPEHRIGDELEIYGVLDKPQNYSGFDYISYLAKENVFAVISFPLAKKIGEGGGNRFKTFLSAIKSAFERNIEGAVPEPHAAFLKGLLLGERESLPEELKEGFNRTGTTHIVALSGYNITLVGSFIVWILLALTLPFRASFWIAVVAVVVFAVMTGASSSVVRASIMGILVLVARREGRMYSVRNALALAGAAMIFHNPLVLRFDAAFQLSFMATLGLVYFSPYLEKIFKTLFSSLSLICGKSASVKKRKKIAEDVPIFFSFKKIFFETVSAQLAVLPLLVYFFGKVSLVSPLVNVLVLAAVPAAMMAGFFAGILGFLWEPLARFAGTAAWALLEYQLKIIEFFAGLPFAYLEIGKWAIFPLAAFYMFFFLKLWKNPDKVKTDF